MARNFENYPLKKKKHRSTTIDKTVFDHRNMNTWEENVYSIGDRRTSTGWSFIVDCQKCKLVITQSLIIYKRIPILHLNRQRPNSKILFHNIFVNGFEKKGSIDKL